MRLDHSLNLPGRLIRLLPLISCPADRDQTKELSDTYQRRQLLDSAQSTEYHLRQLVRYYFGYPSRL